MHIYIHVYIYQFKNMHTLQPYCCVFLVYCPVLKHGWPEIPQTSNVEVYSWENPWLW